MMAGASLMLNNIEMRHEPKSGDFGGETSRSVRRTSELGIAAASENASSNGLKRSLSDTAMAWFRRWWRLRCWQREGVVRLRFDFRCRKGGPSAHLGRDGRQPATLGNVRYRTTKSPLSVPQLAACSKWYQDKQSSQEKMPEVCKRQLTRFVGVQELSCASFCCTCRSPAQTGSGHVPAIRRTL
ncbi:hypothetical protein BDV96DRAFT_139751 [Lophiotrema nucula]|uniref:Uncharacterized protein n=1 Tax=Lophiotrema nucula TaxID=690887 RepID=A0A6A5ZVB6_9PLEO|nr:hypothetical protein BDV96DRAFT_139751 [Lophiotrema nucula]